MKSRFAFWCYNGKEWVVTKETVLAENSNEAKSKLIEKVGKEQYSLMAKPVRVVLV